jgi:hypothetical protein
VARHYAGKLPTDERQDAQKCFGPKSPGPQRRFYASVDLDQVRPAINRMLFDLSCFIPANVERNVDKSLAKVIQLRNPSNSEHAILDSNQWPSAPEARLEQNQAGPESPKGPS